MKQLLTVLVIMVLIVGCANPSVKLHPFPDRSFEFLQTSSGVGIEGGPVTKRGCFILYTNTEKTEVLKANCDSHSAPGTAQQLANTTVGGGLAIIREKERAPYSVSNGDRNTSINVDGGNSQAGAVSESSTNTDVDINTDSEEEDVSYEMSDDYE